MSDKKHDKKAKLKSKMKPDNQSGKDSPSGKKVSAKAKKLEEKAIVKAAKKKIKAIDKQLRKAAEKEAKMARSVSEKMMKKQAKINYERHMTRTEAVHYFVSLILGLDNGNLQLGQGKDTIVIRPAELVDVEIKAETKGKMEKISFEMAWLAVKSSDISISSFPDRQVTIQ